MIDSIRRFMFGPSPLDFAEATVLMTTIQEECRRKSALEDMIFDEWYRANVDTLPVKASQMISAGTEIVMMPVMEDEDFKRFNEYMKRRLTDMGGNRIET